MMTTLLSFTSSMDPPVTYVTGFLSFLVAVLELCPWSLTLQLQQNNKTNEITIKKRMIELFYTKTNQFIFELFLSVTC